MTQVTNELGYHMARAVSEIEQEIRGLDPADQEHLLRALLEELDGPPDADVERAWLEEAQRRSHELDTGAVQAIPAEEVFARARAELKRR
jgi:putative addiction module component (TIGR02574 family)